MPGTSTGESDRDGVSQNIGRKLKEMGLVILEQRRHHLDMQQTHKTSMGAKK
jgi:hypothetical protein